MEKISIQNKLARQHDIFVMLFFYLRGYNSIINEKETLSHEKYQKILSLTYSSCSIYCKKHLLTH